MQVITQIGKVLNITLPPMIHGIIDNFSLLAMSIKSFLQLDCLGVVRFYDEWVVRVFGILLIMVSAAALRYKFEKRHGQAADAAGNLKANIFFIVFVLYPGICNEAFSMFVRPIAHRRTLVCVT